MHTMMHQRCNMSWFTHARKGAIAFCFLLIFMGLVTPPALASSHSQHTATKARDLGSQLRLKHLTELGTFTFGGIAMVSENVGWTFTNTVQRTTDGGLTWQTVAQSDPQGQWFIGQLEVLDEQIAWFLATDSHTFANTALYRTNDGGQTWTRFPWINPRQVMIGMSVFDGQFAWVNTEDTIVGGINHLYLVGGDHQDWQAVTSPVNGTNQIYFNSTKVGWAVGTSQSNSNSVSTLFETRDGAHHWKPLKLQNPASLPATTVLLIRRIFGFANESIGYLEVAFQDAQGITIYRTLDGGKSWEPYGDPQPENTLAIKMDTSRLEPTFPETRFNGGADLATLSLGTWKIHHILYPDSVVMLSFLTDDVMFMSGYTPFFDGQVLFKSLDGGATWQTIATIPFTITF